MGLEEGVKFQEKKEDTKIRPLGRVAREDVRRHILGGAFMFPLGCQEYCQEVINYILYDHLLKLFQVGGGVGQVEEIK